MAAVGWRLGLDRMHSLLEELGHPEQSFAAIHVVGTNGKSSATRMTAALLSAHGTRTGAYLSPHLGPWSERVEIDGASLSESAHAASVERTAAAADRIGGSLDAEEPVSQFEIATAAAFVALADAGVAAAVIEAGMGGRLDATNVLEAPVCVLTSVALDHTAWLGESVEEIASEKLAVVPDGATLVWGELPPKVEALVGELASERNLTVVRAPDLDPAIRLRAAGRIQRRNFALAVQAARCHLGELEQGVVQRVAGELIVPGRMEFVDGDPPEIRDAAHNPAGMAALAEALPEIAAGRPVIACFAALDDKNAKEMARALAPVLEGVVCTEIPGELGAGRRTRPAAELAGLFAAAGLDGALSVPAPAEAWERCREIAREQGGVALAAGSVYLLRALWTGKPDPSCSR